MVPTVSPGYQEKAESVVIKYVHAIVLNTGRYATTGLGPSSEACASFRVSMYNCEKRIGCAIIA